MPEPLTLVNIRESGRIPDFLMAAHQRFPARLGAHKSIRQSLMHARTASVAHAAVKAFTGERAVVSSWGTAEPVFRLAQARGALCVLSYPLAHHRFTRRVLAEESELHPELADTLTGHDRPPWLQERFDAEIDMADYILVGSTFVQESFISEGIPSEKLVVIPYGADTGLFSPAEPSTRKTSDFRLLFVGQIGQRKGISYLFEAVDKIAGPGISLTLVGEIQGDGTAFEPYRHLFRHVRQLPRPELRVIYQQSDVFVFPTIVEGMPLVVLEAMASGLPVVTTPNGPGDIVRDGIDGFLVPPRDADAIATRVNWLRQDTEMRYEMGRNARNRAQSFTWNSYGQRVVAHLKTWLRDLEQEDCNSAGTSRGHAS
ncbi:glycosyltransferase family 4 protein [uncultured Thiohalocapsa sp.]|uniref:glycosyltransferase family 4 protein n=1 Tax=uncultured Thiohalocapsa sp. TaxID=768990 RepID=UPI0025D31941|nr:glycosyltransferase family 4 protein [uncultured Thiohalocapsa sp.]